MERIRDVDYNFAASVSRKTNDIMGNEKGGIFDRVENTGVQPMYIPANNNVELTNAYQKNKQKHTVAAFKLGDTTSSQSAIALKGIANNQAHIPIERKKELINNQFIYLKPE